MLTQDTGNAVLKGSINLITYYHAQMKLVSFSPSLSQISSSITPASEMNYGKL